MLTTEPKIEERGEQPYVGIRTRVPAHKLPSVIPQLINETEAWLGEQGAAPSGAPFIRYYIINMARTMDVEIGWPVEPALRGDKRVAAGIIPAGQYASLVYTDATRGIEGNRVLIDWASANGIGWDAWDTADGHAFRSRVEYLLDGPDDDPDPTNWRTEVAIMIGGA